jgi:carbonic anhydrase/acetyltransferase-like protein (isoleucine patch superfamily)
VPIRSYAGIQPDIDPSAYIDPMAVVAGQVAIGANASLWPFVVARGDSHWIRIGARTNVQDGSILHVTHPTESAPGGFSLDIGADVTVGHRVILHGCTVSDRCLVGMGSTVLDGAFLEPEVMVGAGSVVPPGKRLEGGSLWLGNPVRRIRPLRPDEIQSMIDSVQAYIDLKNQYGAPR